MTQRQAEAVAMTDDQKFIFDIRGWVVIPSVLSSEEIRSIKQHLFTLRDNPQSLPPSMQNSYAGPCEPLLDHPVLVGTLREVISPDVNESAYGFRCDNSFWTIREAGWAPGQGAHNGGPYMGPTHTYRFEHGRIFSPSTRVVWELSAVKHGDGGTRFMFGSHKSNYAIPENHLSIEDPLFEDYECPAGSLVIFTENICHASAPWTNADQPRVAIFTHYMFHAMQFHKRTPPHELVAQMPKKRQTLFRGVWMMDFPPGQMVINDFYTEENRAL